MRSLSHVVRVSLQCNRNLSGNSRDSSKTRKLILILGTKASGHGIALRDATRFPRRRAHLNSAPVLCRKSDLADCAALRTREERPEHVGKVFRDDAVAFHGEMTVGLKIERRLFHPCCPSGGCECGFDVRQRIEKLDAVAFAHVGEARLDLDAEGLDGRDGGCVGNADDQGCLALPFFLPVFPGLSPGLSVSAGTR